MGLYVEEHRETSPLLKTDDVCGSSINEPTEDTAPNLDLLWHRVNRVPPKPLWPTFVKIVLMYGVLVGTYSIVYMYSPPEDEWDHHLDHCPAQKTGCVLMDSESYIIQGTLLTTLGCVLLLTWVLEKPRRPFVRFVADNSKSGLAALMTHFLAGGTTLLLEHIVAKRDGVMTCDLYFAIFLWDSFVGVSLTLIMVCCVLCFCGSMCTIVRF